MTKRISRRFFVGAGLAGLGLPAWADAPKRSLRPVLRPSGGAAKITKAAATPKAASAAALIKEANLGGRVAFAVADAKSGLMLESREGDQAQPPASVTKAVTALYALDALGPGHRFVTRLMANGPVQGGVLKGDLVLMGGGDPTLDTNVMAGLAAKLKAAGVQRVSGQFKVWGGALPSIRQIDKSQPDHVGYNPALSGISLNYNRVHFEWKRGSNGWSTVMDARSDKYRPAVSMARMRVVNRSLPVYTYTETNGQDHWTVASKALGKGGSRWLPVRQPETYAGEVFRALARAQGIKLGAPKVARSRPGGTAIVSHASPELSVILRGMLKYSNNLTAEMVGLAATTKRKGKVNSLKASASEMSRWANASLGMSKAKLVDHSGLGSDSRLTAKDMTVALVKVRKQGALRPILKKIAMRHSNGKVNKGHPIKVFAKTGTLNFVSALAGYLVAADGTEMAFTIFAADAGKRAQIKRGDREKPQGARGWNKRAKKLQQKLIERWGTLYGT
ncbi:D-alanyl-D-alanine carboxypeptidase/D-alanyl-D-alanine-endopeptidase [Alisedimentitalea sp. MJ-SS2]|uniref:D-alanyl-D-alanine carboxypeptidase/D-alanyl-D-alanine endopeptidase n=1 Tax=Aliisedimentitalea sp. MJ-SS2 TaxID=3049795 RepID=UPI00290708D3|nr:D-alanyl-D-alanine carboxypeptidase/D-alanyl-D-alanine-endopeptidase [Alisedimentitalea sp. MJ-SS2]MDU8927471.1 D-alanyl-D-alanine carboxypeptidase/D-alanyl-D-alanine-endopeptidase [Alisedimentitalea sp. MJ-SS2]